MKKAMTFGLLLTALFAFTGCEDDDAVFDPRPQPPQGVFSITGDGEVELWWAGPYDRDIDEYWIYRATAPVDDPPTQYEYLAAIDVDDNPDLNLRWYPWVDNNVTNGVTYWYAVASVDHAGQVSDLSAEDVFDTPRPEGQTMLFDYRFEVGLAGFNFNAQSHVSAGSALADVWVDRFQGIFYLNAGDTLDPGDTDIQDMGYTGSWDAIGYAPTEGWSDLGYAEVILGHTYIIWTENNHFVKMRVVAIHNDPDDPDYPSVEFQWAWQPDPGNPELISSKPGTHTASTGTAVTKEASASK